QRMRRAALEGLAGEPVRVLASTNRRAPPVPIEVPGNARLVDWISYARAMPRCDMVVCHGGHGTLVRALACGVPVVACPAGGDMAENASRLVWPAPAFQCRGGSSARAGYGSRFARCCPGARTRSAHASFVSGPSETMGRR